MSENTPETTTDGGDAPDDVGADTTIPDDGTPQTNPDAPTQDRPDDGTGQPQ